VRNHGHELGLEAVRLAEFLGPTDLFVESGQGLAHDRGDEVDDQLAVRLRPGYRFHLDGDGFSRSGVRGAFDGQFPKSGQGRGGGLAAQAGRVGEIEAHHAGDLPADSERQRHRRLHAMLRGRRRQALLTSNVFDDD